MDGYLVKRQCESVGTYPGDKGPRIQDGFNVFEPARVFQTPQEVTHGWRPHLPNCKRASKRQEGGGKSTIKRRSDLHLSRDPHPNTRSTTYHRWFSAGCSSSHECSQCRWTAAWCWCNSPHSHSLYPLLDSPWHLAVYESIVTVHHCTIYHANNPGEEERYLGSGVHHVDAVAARVGLHYGLQHQLILLTSSAEPWQRLAAAADGGLRRSSASLSKSASPSSSKPHGHQREHEPGFLESTDQRVPVEVSKSWKASSAPEPGAAHDDVRSHRLWHKQLWWVSVTHLPQDIKAVLYKYAVGSQLTINASSWVMMSLYLYLNQTLVPVYHFRNIIWGLLASSPTIINILLFQLSKPLALSQVLIHGWVESTPHRKLTRYSLLTAVATHRLLGTPILL